MKKIKYYLLGLIACSALVFQSCSEDKMDDINKNKDNPEFMESKYIITDVITNTAFTVTGSDLAFYAGVYSELVGGGHAQMYNAEVRANEPVANSTYNNSWNSIYRNLRNLHIIVNKCSEGGEEQGNYHTLAIAQILTAYNLGVLTDLWGDVPYFEALSPLANPQAKVDSQEDLYQEIFRLLDASIENLEKNSTYASLGGQDIIYNGSTSAWKNVAYGLKARYTMHLANVKPDYQSVIDNVNKSFKSIADDFYFKSEKVNYSFFEFDKSRKALFSSKTLYDIISSLDDKDPRLVDYFPAIGSEGEKQIKLLDHSVLNNIIQSNSTYSPSGLSTTSNSDNAKNVIYLLSYHELLFLKAEAEARLGLPEAKATLEDAVKASLNKKQAYKYLSYDRKIPDLTGNELIKRIALEKYIAFYEVESIEAFNDIRRWKGMGENLIPLQHEKPELFPLRFTYGNSDVSNNNNVAERYGDGSYVYTEKVWWAGGTR